MDPHQFFEVRKTSIKGVCGIRDVEFRIFLIGKEIGKIQSQAPVGRAKPFMGVVPSSREWVYGSLLEKR